MRASDGAVLGVYPVGPGPGGLAFDGTNIWVANSGAVKKLWASDGANLDTIAVGQFPFAGVFESTNIWMANNLGNTVSKR